MVTFPLARVITARFGDRAESFLAGCVRRYPAASVGVSSVKSSASQFEYEKSVEMLHSYFEVKGEGLER